MLRATHNARFRSLTGSGSFVIVKSVNPVLHHRRELRRWSTMGSIKPNARRAKQNTAAARVFREYRAGEQEGLARNPSTHS
jgi:hypothetical protein